MGTLEDPAVQESLAWRRDIENALRRQQERFEMWLYPLVFAAVAIPVFYFGSYVHYGLRGWALAGAALGAAVAGLAVAAIVVGFIVDRATR